MSDIFKDIIKLQERQQTGILVTVVDKQGHGPAIVGKKLLLTSDGQKRGTIGGGDLEFLAVKKASTLLREKGNALLSYDFSGNNPVDGFTSLDMICGGYVTLFFEYLPLSPCAYIMGCGHVGRNVSRLLMILDYHVTVMDDRKEAVENFNSASSIVVGNFEETIPTQRICSDSYVIIAAYSHDVDYKILKTLVTSEVNPAYIGLLASPAKGQIIISKLKKELGNNFKLNNLYSPIGLDIGGQTPEEIAISIVAEMQSIRYKKIGNKHLKEK